MACRFLQTAVSYDLSSSTQQKDFSVINFIKIVEKTLDCGTIHWKFTFYAYSVKLKIFVHAKRACATPLPNNVQYSHYTDLSNAFSFFVFRLRKYWYAKMTSSEELTMTTENVYHIANGQQKCFTDVLLKVVAPYRTAYHITPVDTVPKSLLLIIIILIYQLFYFCKEVV